MMKNIFVIGLCGLCIQPASAVYFDSIIYDMDARKDFISRPIVNDTKNNNLYTISAYKISRPGNGDERPVPGQDKDLVWSPLQFTVQANGQEYFKLYYRGPKDAVERYYRVIFKETPVTIFPWRQDQKKLNVVPSVSMSTILIVRPRKTRFQYEINEATGTIKIPAIPILESSCRKAAMVTMKVQRNFICCQGRAGQAPRRRIATGNTLSH